MGRNQIYLKILQVSKETGIPTKKVMDIFYFLHTGKPVDNHELLMKVGISKNAINQIKKALRSLLNDVSRNTQLKKNVRQDMQTLFATDYKIEDELYSALGGESFEKIINLLEKCSDLRPAAKREYDQFTATIETTAKRAVLLQFFEDIAGKRILFLGDNDFTSVAISRYRRAAEIAVLDIDTRILNNIGKASKQQSFNITTVAYDARKQFPKKLSGKFDVVFTDPPYTPNGITLFVSRAIDSLDKTNQSARVYVCYGTSDKAKERFLPIYRAFLDLGLMIRWVFDKFNRYKGAESIGNTSTLFVCEVTPKTKSLIHGNYEKTIYTFN
ncbi:MAG: bis-aminopropyl spermidine synthase family protein [Patescibacteria group bacterium]